MADIVANSSFTLNGVSNFNIGGTVFQWDNHWLGYISIFAPNPGQNLTATATFTGSNWYVSTPPFSAEANLKVILNDAAAGASRHINYLQLNGASSKVTLTNTQIDLIRGGHGVDDVTLGTQHCDAVFTKDGNDIVRTGAGFVN